MFKKKEKEEKRNNGDINKKFHVIIYNTKKRKIFFSLSMNFCLTDKYNLLKNMIMSDWPLSIYIHRKKIFHQNIYRILIYLYLQFSFLILVFSNLKIKFKLLLDTKNYRFTLFLDSVLGIIKKYYKTTVTLCKSRRFTHIKENN